VTLDLAAYLDDAPAFARDFMGVQPFNHQAAVLRAAEEVLAIYKGRQTGMTTALLCKLGHAAMTRPRSTCLYTSAGGRQAEDVGERFLDLVQGQPLARSITSDTKTTIRFSNGSVAHFLPSNADTLRGYGPRWWGRGRVPGMLAIADEAPFIPEGDRVRRALQYTLLAAPEGRRQLVLCGTPAGVTNWTYSIWRAGKDGEPGIRSFTFPTQLNPHADAALVSRLRAMALPGEEAQELDGVPMEGAACMFPGALLDPALVPADVVSFPIPAEPGWLFSVGGDLHEPWSKGTDRTALALVGKGLVGGEAVYVLADLWVRSAHTNAEVVEQAEDWRRRYPLHRVRLEQTAAGGVHEDLLAVGAPSELVSPTTERQAEAFRGLHKLLEARRLAIPKAAPCIEGELRQFERRITDTGRPQFGHPAGSRKVHDDCVYALAWACSALADVHPSPPGVAGITVCCASTLDRREMELWNG
jgi:hypothetical protein